MASEIERITNTFLQGPERIEVARQATASEMIEQRVVEFRASRKDRAASEKRRLMRELIESEGEALRNAIVFCNRKSEVDVLAKSLKKYGYDAAPIHGDLDQATRTRTLESFRDGSLRFLIASDVAARGLDVPNVSHVFNFDVPSHSEDYVHRIGRTGRAGRAGKAITIAGRGDEVSVEAIEKLLEKSIPRLDSPFGKPAPSPTAADEPASRQEPPAEKPKRRRSRRAVESKPAKETTVEAEEAEATGQPENKPEKKGRSGSRRANQGGEEAVVGMGDHLPAFIAQSFDERRAG